MLIDSHAHITNASLEDDLDEILRNAKKSGVGTIVNIATHPEELEKGLLLSSQTCEAYPKIYHAAATTPHDAEKEGELYFEYFAKSAREKKLVAIGETGLDYYYYRESAASQKKILRRYFQLSKETGLPVVIHCRDAFEDFFAILDEEMPVQGILHCFTGTLDEAKKVIERGWFLSLSGIVTFKKSLELKDVAKWVPMDSLLIETDTPYLAPQAYRGKRNEPAYLVETARHIADLRGISLEALANATSQNARRAFHLV